jgi:hypothetical protein
METASFQAPYSLPLFFTNVLLLYLMDSEYWLLYQQALLLQCHYQLQKVVGLQYHS